LKFIAQGVAVTGGQVGVPVGVEVGVPVGVEVETPQGTVEGVAVDVRSGVGVGEHNGEVHWLSNIWRTPVMHGWILQT
jgi:hypothetical protein